MVIARIKKSSQVKSNASVFHSKENVAFYTNKMDDTAYYEEYNEE